MSRTRHVRRGFHSRGAWPARHRGRTGVHRLRQAKKHAGWVRANVLRAETPASVLPRSHDLLRDRRECELRPRLRHHASRPCAPVRRFHRSRRTSIRARGTLATRPRCVTTILHRVASPRFHGRNAPGAALATSGKTRPEIRAIGDCHRHNRRDGHPSTMLRSVATRASCEARCTPDCAFARTGGITDERRVHVARRFASGPGRIRNRNPPSHAILRRARVVVRHVVRPRGRSPSDAPSSIERCAPFASCARGVDVSIDQDRRFSCVRVTGCTTRSIEGAFHRTNSPELSVFHGLAMGTLSLPRPFLANRSTERTFSFPDLGHPRDSKKTLWFPMRDASQRLAWHAFHLAMIHACTVGDSIPRLCRRDPSPTPFRARGFIPIG